MQRITNDRDPRDPRPGPRAHTKTKSHQITHYHTKSHISTPHRHHTNHTRHTSHHIGTKVDTKRRFQK